LGVVVLGPKKSLYTKTYGKLGVEVYLLSKHRVIVYVMEGFILPEHIDAYLTDLIGAV
jgi:hypothetical protein